MVLISLINATLLVVVDCGESVGMMQFNKLSSKRFMCSLDEMLLHFGTGGSVMMLLVSNTPFHSVSRRGLSGASVISEIFFNKSILFLLFRGLKSTENG